MDGIPQPRIPTGAESTGALPTGPESTRAVPHTDREVLSTMHAPITALKVFNGHDDRKAASFMLFKTLLLHKCARKLTRCKRVRDAP